MNAVRRFACILLGLILLPSFQCTAASPHHTNDIVVTFPSLGWSTTNGGAVTFHAWVQEPERRRFTISLLRHTLGLETGPADAEAKAVFKDRTRYFMGDDEAGTIASVQCNEQQFKLHPSTADGHTKGEFYLTPTELKALLKQTGTNDSFIPYRITLPAPVNRSFTGEVLFLAENGTSVISDVDDTIKITEVGDKKAMLQNTFFKPFRPVKGMPELYQAWAVQGAHFHYVSASPWQLYPALSDFCAQQKFPAGTFQLKSFRVKDRTFLSLFESPDEYKWSVIEPLMKLFPHRQFILVGDSGEKDPEAYGRIARAFPQQVTKIYIHNITKEGPDAPRYAVAFKDLPKSLWQIFTEPDEVPRKLPSPSP